MINFTYIAIAIGAFGLGYGVASREWRKSYEELAAMIEKCLVYRQTGEWKE